MRVGPDGKASVTFDLPAFNGTARVMAVAWTKDRVGSASTDVIIRDPVVLAGTLPRFLSIGDQSRFLDAAPQCRIAGRRIHRRGRLFGAGGDPGCGPAADDAARRERRGSIAIPVTAAGSGTAVLDVKVSGGGFEGAQRFSLRTQPGSGGLVRRDVRPLAAGQSLTISQDLIADILPGTGAVSVSVSPLSALDVPGLLQALDRYPYGCSEQLVSRAMPLLYVNRLARQDRLGLDDRPTSACAPRSSGCSPGRTRTAPSACGRSAATTSGSPPT